MTINASGWRPEMGGAGDTGPATFTGNKGLMLEEALIFEIGSTETTTTDDIETLATALEEVLA